MALEEEQQDRDMEKHEGDGSAEGLETVDLEKEEDDEGNGEKSPAFVAPVAAVVEAPVTDEETTDITPTQRMESDSLGEVAVPAAKLYGAQTARSISNFKIGGDAARMPLPVIHAFGLLKKCVAEYNAAQGNLEARMAGAVSITLRSSTKVDCKHRVIIQLNESMNQSIHTHHADRTSGGRGACRCLGRALSARRLPDWVRHADEHERERGNLKPSDPAPRRRRGEQIRAPQ